MASFLEDLWNSIFTPGATPTLLIATNASFAALQAVLLALLLATKSIHFLILSALCAGLWYAINWFVHELQIEQNKNKSQPNITKDRSPEPGSDTETEADKALTASLPKASKEGQLGVVADSLPQSTSDLRERRSVGDSSGYVSTDSEWEKVSEGQNVS